MNNFPKDIIDFNAPTNDYVESMPELKTNQMGSKKGKQILDPGAIGLTNRNGHPSYHK